MRGDYLPHERSRCMYSSIAMVTMGQAGRHASRNEAGHRTFAVTLYLDMDGISGLIPCADLASAAVHEETSEVTV